MLVPLISAAYSEPSKKKYGNVNSAECPFPGSKSVKFFSPTSSPAAVAWNGSAAKVSIAYITLNVSDGSISFTTGNEIFDEPDLPDLPTEKNLVYHESFEKSITGRMTINSIFGNETWRTYTKGNFVMNADFIPEATDGDKILMLFSGKGNLMNESEAVSRDIDVEPGVNYTMSVDVYCETSSSTIPTFSLFIEDDYGEYNIYTANETTTAWKNIELPLTFAGNKFRYKLYGRVCTGGVFVDNLRLYKEVWQTSISDAAVQNETSIGIYRLDGTQISSLNSHRGINIVRLPNGTVIKTISR